MPLNQEETVATLCRLAAAQASVNPAEVTLDTNFVSDLNYDSLAIVEFIMTVEDAFEIDIPDERAENVHTVRDAYDILLSLMPSNVTP